MALFYAAAALLTALGFTTVVLPFVLVFTIVYAILQQTKVLADQKNINAMVATVLGLFVVASLQLVEQLNTFIAWSGILLIVLLVVFLILGLTGITINKNKWYWHVALVLIMAVLLVFVLLSVFRGGTFWRFFSSTFFYTMLVALVLVFAIVFIVSDRSSPVVERNQAPRSPQPSQRRPSPEQIQQIQDAMQSLSPEARNALAQLQQNPDQVQQMVERMPDNLRNELEASGLLRPL